VPEGSSRARALDGDDHDAQSQAPAGGLGSLADKLRGALGSRED